MDISDNNYCINHWLLSINKLIKVLILTSDYSFIQYKISDIAVVKAQ